MSEISQTKYILNSTCFTSTGVARAKGELFASASEGDTCILNGDDPLVSSLHVPHGAQVLSYGSKCSSECPYDVVFSDVELADFRSTTFTLTTCHEMEPSQERVAITAPGSF